MGCFQAKSTGQGAHAPTPVATTDDPKPLGQADNKTKVIAQRSPFPVDMEAGKAVYFCTCGRSTNQPFCDGKHVGTAFTPMPYTPERAGKEYFCGCKATKKPPHCDGSHQSLKW